MIEPNGLYIPYIDDFSDSDDVDAVAEWIETSSSKQPEHSRTQRGVQREHLKGAALGTIDELKTMLKQATTGETIQRQAQQLQQRVSKGKEQFSMRSTAHFQRCGMASTELREAQDKVNAATLPFDDKIPSDKDMRYFPSASSLKRCLYDSASMKRFHGEMKDKAIEGASILLAYDAYGIDMIAGGARLATVHAALSVKDSHIQDAVMSEGLFAGLLSCSGKTREDAKRIENKFRAPDNAADD